MNYDIDRFLADLKGTRERHIVELVRDGEWKDYNWLYDTVLENARQKCGYKGRGIPHLTRKAFKYFLNMGFLQLDPQKGVRMNPDFIPRNQV